MQQHWLIATDLDGTLLDDSYPNREAADAIDQIQAAYPNVKVALVSSKTLEEMSRIADFVERKPFLIFENGGGVAWPLNYMVSCGDAQIAGYEVKTLGMRYEEICCVLGKLRSKGYDFCGFVDMSAEEVASLTRLTPADAELARGRLTSEPLVWQGDTESLHEFAEALREQGLTLQRGGRFYHVTSANDKIKALDYLRERIRYETGVQLRVLACGDAPNDLAMLDKADCALVFPDRDGKYLRESQAHIAHAPAAGPKTWLRGVSKLAATAMNAEVESSAAIGT